MLQIFPGVSLKNITFFTIPPDLAYLGTNHDIAHVLQLIFGHE